MNILGVIAAGVLAPAAIGALTTLDPLKAATDIILSSGNLRAETNSPTGGGSVLSVAGLSSGTAYFEVQPDQFYAANPGFLTGISIGTGTQSSYPGATSSSRGLASTASGSDTWNSGSSSNNSAGGAANLSHYHSWYVDVDNGRAYARISNRSSNAWIGGGDPLAGTSPTFTFTPGSTIYLMVCPRRGHASTSSDRNRLVVRVDPTTWVGTAPAGSGSFVAPAPASPVLAVYNSTTPSTDSAIPAPVLASINDYLDLEWTARVEWFVQSSSTAFYAWSLDSGSHSLRYTGGESGNWILRINGADVVTAASIVTSAATGQRSTAGQFISVRAWWDLASSTKGIQMSVNGVYAYATSASASGSSVATPTTGFLNSLSGGSPNADLEQIALVVHSRDSSRVKSFNGAVIGDSTVASYNSASGVPVASLLRTGARSRNSAIKSLAIGGATIAEQETAWVSFAEKSDLRWIMIQVGLNDIDPAEAASAAIARLQSLVNAVNATKPASAKVLIATMNPCYARMVTRYGAGAPADNSYAKWQAMNTAIAGGGGSPITGVDFRVTSHTAALDDGVGNLAAPYDSGDGIHPNNFGRQIVADAWATALIANRLL